MLLLLTLDFIPAEPAGTFFLLIVLLSIITSIWHFLVPWKCYLERKMSKPLPARQKTYDSHQAAQRSQIASPCHWFVPGHDSWSCLATLMLQCWQEGLSHVFSAPLGASGYILSTWTWHEILWSESDELSYLAGNYPRKLSVGWVCWSECLPSHELMGRCRSRMVSGAGNPH